LSEQRKTNQSECEKREQKKTRWCHSYKFTVLSGYSNSGLLSCLWVPFKLSLDKCKKTAMKFSTLFYK
jgi:hypothetical protein